MRPPGEGENNNKAVCVTSNANGFRSDVGRTRPNDMEGNPFHSGVTTSGNSSHSDGICLRHIEKNLIVHFVGVR